jgi:NAD(P)-dependent dehydrogenase (short-subunit alcohol dehydrogenase family)
MGQLKRSVVIVAGALSGIRLATARCSAAAGTKMVLTAAHGRYGRLGLESVCDPPLAVRAHA